MFYSLLFFSPHNRLRVINAVSETYNKTAKTEVVAWWQILISNVCPTGYVVAVVFLQICFFNSETKNFSHNLSDQHATSHIDPALSMWVSTGIPKF